MKRTASSINEDLNSLPIYRGKKCNLCGRSYPDTLLNIEAVIHHPNRGYVCVDTKSCNRTKRHRR